MVDVFHNLSGKSCLDRRYFLKYLVGCAIFPIAAAYGSQPTVLENNTLFPRIMNFGILNTLYGVNIDDARVVLEMNLNRQSTIGIQSVEPKLEIVPDVARAANLIRQRHLHGIFISGIDYILLREMVATKPLYVASALTASPAESYIVVTAKEIDWKKLSSMARRRLMVEHYNQWDIGRIWLETELNRMQLPKSELFFTAIQVADKPMRMVLPVFFGQADACLMTESAYQTMVELNPQLGQKLRILIRSPGVIKSLFCIADFLDPRFIVESKKVMRKMHLTRDGQQLMMIFRIKQFYPFRPEDLEATERILNRYRTISPEFAMQYLELQADEQSRKRRNISTKR